MEWESSDSSTIKTLLLQQNAIEENYKRYIGEKLCPSITKINILSSSYLKTLDFYIKILKNLVE